MKLLVRNLPRTMSEFELREMFKKNTENLNTAK